MIAVMTYQGREWAQNVASLISISTVVVDDFETRMMTVCSPTVDSFTAWCAETVVSFGDSMTWACLSDDGDEFYVDVTPDGEVTVSR